MRKGFDADGKVNIAIWRPSTGGWTITQQLDQSNDNHPLGL